MRLASLITWSVTVLLLLAARGSSTIQTPKEGSASRVDILENAYGLRVLEDKDYRTSRWRTCHSMNVVTRPVPDERKDGADGQVSGGSGV